MPNDAGTRVAVDVGLPFPARGIGMASADVLALQPLEFLLVAKLVGLEGDKKSAHTKGLV